jgi:hypothetical protein
MTLKSLISVESYDIMTATSSNISQNVTIRWAVPADLPALERVAALDSKRLPAGPLLVAVVDGQIWAALSTLDEGAVADPFTPSGDLVGLLRTRASQLRDSQPREPVLRLEPLLARLR